MLYNVIYIIMHIYIHIYIYIYIYIYIDFKIVIIYNIYLEITLLYLFKCNMLSSET